MELEERERKPTGIKNLKVKFNKVFGYYLDVTNSYKDLVPDHYIRKQTLANSERYTTEELNQLADTILGSEDRLYAMEYETFVEIRETLAGEMERIAKTAHVIAQIDALASLAYVAERNHYVRPKLNHRGTIDIKEGRHPVVEQMIQNDMFISNDTYLDQKKNRVSIITGPIVGAGSPSDLIQNQKTVLCGISKDIRHLAHLNHKRTLTGCQIIRGSYSGKNSIHNSDICLFRRNK